MWVLDWHLEQIHAERMAQAEASEDLAHMALAALDNGDTAAALQAWLLAGNSAASLAELTGICDYLNELD